MFLLFVSLLLVLLVLIVIIACFVVVVVVLGTGGLEVVGWKWWWVGVGQWQRHGDSLFSVFPFYLLT